MRIALLGAGRMARGALHEYLRHADVESVVVADRSAGALDAIRPHARDPRVRFTVLDAADLDSVRTLLAGCDAALSAMHYGLNPGLTRVAIETRTHLVDLGGNNDVVRAQLDMDAEARTAGVSVIPDCGLAPGLASMLVAWGMRRLPWVQEVRIRVGGLPLEPKEPLRYERLFNVEGLINEYVEPPLVLRDGRRFEAQPLGDVERVDFEQPVGTLEAFNTSGGVSTLIDTYGDRLRTLDYKTLRYPGHAVAMRWLLELGLMASEPVDVDGASIVPRHLLARAIERAVPECARDRTLVRVTFSGEGRTHALDINDTFDEATGLTSMMRTTAFPAVTASLMQARGQAAAGVQPQERVLDPDSYVTAIADTGIVVRGLTSR